MLLRHRTLALLFAATATTVFAIAPQQAIAQEEPLLGEVRLFAGNFAPLGWAFCDGRILSIAQNDALFSLLGTTFGGDGRTTFALPDLRGRAPVHAGRGPDGSEVGMGQSGDGVSVVPSTEPGAPSTLPYLGLRYIIATSGRYPSRS